MPALHEALREVAEEEGPAPLRDMQKEISAHFSKGSVAEILASLRADGGDWAVKTADTIETKSPTSTLVAYAQVREGKSLDFEDCMRLEYRLINGFVKGHDFYEGVRAVVIDKDHFAEVEACHARRNERGRREELFCAARRG